MASKVSIDRELSEFQPEIEYAFSVIGEWIGEPLLVVPGECADALIDYGAAPRAAPIHIHERFFSEFCCLRSGRVSLKAPITADRAAVRKEKAFGTHFYAVFSGDEGPALNHRSADPDRSIVNFDLIGAVFFFLSRMEELDRSDLDRYGRFKAERTLAFNAGVLDVPVVDLLIELLVALLNGLPSYRGPVAPTPRIHVTHDVDRLRVYHTRWRFLRERAGDVLKRGVGIVESGQSTVRGLTRNEPQISITQFMDLADEFGVKGQFFLQAGSSDPMDADYYARFQKDFRWAIREIQRRGHTVGFHPGYHTYDAPNLWLAQKACLEETVGKPVTAGRQHVLRFHPDTWKIWEQADMELDYTLAFPSGVTYRAGTTRRFPVFGLADRKRYRLQAVPTAIMDFALFSEKYEAIPEDEAYRQIDRAIGFHARFGGDLAILFHTVTGLDLVPHLRRVLQRATDGFAA